MIILNVKNILYVVIFSIYFVYGGQAFAIVYADLQPGWNENSISPLNAKPAKNQNSNTPLNRQNSTANLEYKRCLLGRAEAISEMNVSRQRNEYDRLKNLVGYYHHEASAFLNLNSKIAEVIVTNSDKNDLGKFSASLQESAKFYSTTEHDSDTYLHFYRRIRAQIDSVLGENFVRFKEEYAKAIIQGLKEDKSRPYFSNYLAFAKQVFHLQMDLDNAYSANLPFERFSDLKSCKNMSYKSFQYLSWERCTFALPYGLASPLSGDKRYPKELDYQLVIEPAATLAIEKAISEKSKAIPLLDIRSNVGQFTAPFFTNGRDENVRYNRRYVVITTIYGEHDSQGKLLRIYPRTKYILDGSDLQFDSAGQPEPFSTYVYRNNELPRYLDCKRPLDFSPTEVIEELERDAQLDKYRAAN